MKIRTGFVSNSSSSSFIIETGKSYKTVFDVAKDMLKQVNSKSQLNFILDRIKNTKKDPNTPVMFYSCNYDTYISKYGNHFLINTCNNEDWHLKDEIGESTATKLYPELDNGYKEIDFEKIEKDTTYWHLERDFMFQKSEDYSSCDRKGPDGKRLCGYGEFVKINGEDQCPECFHLKDGTPSQYLLYKNRDKKLERIINNER